MTDQEKRGKAEINIKNGRKAITIDTKAKVKTRSGNNLLKRWKYLQIILTDEGLILKIYKQLIQFNILKNTSNSMRKWALDLNKHLSKENKQMANGHKKRGSKLQIFREMKVKILMRYHLTLVKMALIKKITRNTCWQGCGGERVLVHSQWECKSMQYGGSSKTTKTHYMI